MIFCMFKKLVKFFYNIFLIYNELNMNFLKAKSSRKNNQNLNIKIKFEPIFCGDFFYRVLNMSRKIHSKI